MLLLCSGIEWKVLRPWITYTILNIMDETRKLKDKDIERQNCINRMVPEEYNKAKKA